MRILSITASFEAFGGSPDDAIASCLSRVAGRNLRGAQETQDISSGIPTVGFRGETSRSDVLWGNRGCLTTPSLQVVSVPQGLKASCAPRIHAKRKLQSNVFAFTKRRAPSTLHFHQTLKATPTQCYRPTLPTPL